MSNQRFSVLQAKAVEDKRISNAQFRTLAALGMYGDKEGWCYPKLKTLAAVLGKSKQAVSKDLILLAELGYIQIKHQFREDGSQQNSLFRLLFDTTRQPDIDPHQDNIDPPSTSEVDPPSTSEVDGGSTSEVDALTPHINAPINAPLKLADDDFPVGSLIPYSGAFVEKTHIPEGAGGQRYFKALQDIRDRGCTVDDLREGIQTLIDCGYSISGPWSCVNAANNVRMKREGKTKSGSSALDEIQFANVSRP